MLINNFFVNLISLIVIKVQIKHYQYVELYVLIFFNFAKTHLKHVILFTVIW